MKSTATITVTFVSLLTVAARTTCADDAADKWLLEQFGAAIQQVAATLSSDDDIKLAQQMLEAAKANTDHPQRVDVLANQIYRTLFRLPDHADLIIESQRLLIEHLPRKREFALNTIINVLQRRFGAQQTPENARPVMEAMIERAVVLEEAGKWPQASFEYRRAASIAKIAQPALEAPLTAARHRAARIDGLLKRLRPPQTDPEAADELAHIAIVEMDRPQFVKSYVRQITHPTMPMIVELTAQPLDAFSEQQCLALGWAYLPIAASAGDEYEPALLLRTYKAFRRYLDLHGADDAERAEVQSVFNDVKTRMAELGVPEPKPPITRIEIERGGEPKPTAPREGEATNKLFKALRVPPELRQQSPENVNPQEAPKQ